MHTWTDAQLAYLAGIFDGEGSVYIWTRRNRGYRDYGIRLYVVNTNRTLIDWLQATFGGLVYSRQSAKWKERHEWLIDRKNADSLMSAMLPYMIIKRPQMEVAIRFRETFQVRAARLTDEVVSLREACRLEVRGLNSRAH